MNEQYITILAWVGIAVVFYFLIIRPQSQKRKKEKAFTESLKKGERVVTTSGIHGKILDIIENKGTVILETGAGKLTFEQSAVSMELTQDRMKDKKSVK